MGFVYRLIDPSEYALLKAFLYKAIFIPEGDTPPPYDVIYVPSLYHYIKDFGKQGDVCFVCENNGKIVGAAWSRILDATDNRGYGNVGEGIPELSVSVLPDSRDQGIGTELLRRLHAALGKLGYSQISLSVQTANPAMRLYERCGYRILKEQDADYIMVCDLQCPKRTVKGLSAMTLEELWQLFPIELSEHNPIWADWYEEEKWALLTFLGDVVKRIDHIGSTSIDGLLAKPIVDILLQVAPECDIDRLKSALSANGWLLIAEQTTSDMRSDWNKGYTLEGFAEKVFHLHVRQVGDWDEPYFRDYITDHQEAAAEYEALKQVLLAKYKHNRDAYTDAKGDFIRACTAKGREEKWQK